MAFGALTTLYLPSPSDAGSALGWGVGVFRLTETPSPVALVDAAPNLPATITNHGTTATPSQLRTVWPYVNNNANRVEADYGWAINPADIGSTEIIKRFYPAGAHTLNLFLAQSTQVPDSGTLSVFVYKVGTAAAGRARTLLGQGGATYLLPAGTTGGVTAVVPVDLPSITFDPDETIQYSLEFTVPGVAVTNRTIRYYPGNITGVTQARITTPPLGGVTEATGAAIGSAVATAETGKVLNTVGAAAGSVVVAGTSGAMKTTTGTVAASSSAEGAGAARAGTVGAAAGAATVTSVPALVKSVTGTSQVSSGGGTVLRPIFVFDD